MATGETLTADEQRLAELGYKQELKRGWSGFSNFAISFSIISILAGCFTTYGQAWNNGGPIAISIAWPLISVLVLLVAFSMAELASAMPTAGGIYYWASKLGGAGLGMVHRLVQPRRPRRRRRVRRLRRGDVPQLDALASTTLHLFGVNFATTSVQSALHHTFVLFVLLLAGARADQHLLLATSSRCSRTSRCGGT